MNLAHGPPVVKTLARQQFDDFVKRVRIFVHPRLSEELKPILDLPELLQEAIRRLDS